MAVLEGLTKMADQVVQVQVVHVTDKMVNKTVDLVLNLVNQENQVTTDLEMLAEMVHMTATLTTEHKVVLVVVQVAQAVNQVKEQMLLLVV